MKIVSIFFTLMLFASMHLFSQIEVNTVSGAIKEVKSHFAGEHTLVVNNVELVLLTNLKDPSSNSFEINKEYKDILIKKGDAFILNPRYKGNVFEFTYNVNGKGWKCITKVSPLKAAKVMEKKQ